MGVSYYWATGWGYLYLRLMDGDGYYLRDGDGKMLTVSS